MKIQYDDLPRYCKVCKLQGHDEIDCWRWHPELMVYNKDNQGVQENATDKEKNKGPLMILTSGKVVGMLKNGKKFVISV